MSYKIFSLPKDSGIGDGICIYVKENDNVAFISNKIPECITLSMH